MLVAAVIVGLALLSATPGRARSGAPPVTPGAVVTAADAESSSWYCTGQGQVDRKSVV